MGLIAKQGGGDFQQPPAGQFLAICYQVIDMGHQHSPVYNKWQPKVRFAFELHGDNMVGEGSSRMDDGKPFTVSALFTSSLGENAALRPFLEGWRGRPFTEQELEGFDVSNVLGAPCMVTIQHATENRKHRCGDTDAQGSDQAGSGQPARAVLSRPVGAKQV